MNIFIAGASGGIGRYLSECFDVEGNTLYITYNNNIHGLYTPKYANSEIILCDFTNEEHVKQAFEDIEELDVLINVIGVVRNNLIKNMEISEWDGVIESNLKALFLSCKHSVKIMKTGGHIINISSILGKMGMIGASNYATSKGGVEAFTKSFALECIRKKVFVNCISLGYFKIGMGLQLNGLIESLIKKKIPIGEFGEPEEIFKMIEYIISSKYLVGQVLKLNGGLRI